MLCVCRWSTARRQQTTSTSCGGRHDSVPESAIKCLTSSSVNDGLFINEIRLWEVWSAIIVSAGASAPCCPSVNMQRLT